MLKNITLDRPLAIIDLETTGTDPQRDRIVELCIVKISVDGQQDQFTSRINPDMAISAGATAVHGITDADVTDEPRFGALADKLLTFLDGCCDLCGFNILRFDLRILSTEFTRAGRPFSLEGRAIIDAMKIFHRYEPRNLAAAVKFYLGRAHDDAHSAAADALATTEILDAMVARYADLPKTIAGLDEHLRDPNSVDLAGQFVQTDGHICFAFGKHRGQRLDVIAARKPDYLRWMLKQTFLDDTKAIVRTALTSRLIGHCPNYQ